MTTPIHDLHPKQLQTVRLIADGYTTKEIAHKLSITEGTVESYKASMFRQFGLKTSPQLIDWAYQNGVLKINQQ